MKKFYTTLLIALCTLSVQAWVIPDNYTTTKINVKTGDMSYRYAAKSMTSSKRVYVLFDKESQLVASYGMYPVAKTNDGIFVGRYMETEGGTSYRADVMFMVGTESTPYPIKSVKVTYYKFNPDNSFNRPTHYDNILSTIENINGKEYITTTFKPNGPTSHFSVIGNDEGSYNTKCVLAKDYGYGVKGIIITNIEIEYVTAKSQPYIDMANTITENSKHNDINNINNIITATELTAYANRAKASTGDVNLDGTINSSDVVTIYNTIANGTTTQTKSGQPYVDLGLPSGIKWATCNLGATTPEGYGDYFSWAPSDSSFAGGKINFSSANYKSNIANDLCSIDGTAYAENQFPPYSITRYHNAWQSWRLPTSAEYKELLSYCTVEQYTLNGVSGTLFTSKINQQTLFFPYNGYIGSGKIYNVNSDGTYWTKSSTEEDCATVLVSKGISTRMEDKAYRHVGRGIRCVTY